MDGVSAVAHWIQAFVAGQAWMAPIGPFVRQIPDWALVASAPIFLVALLLAVFAMRRRKSHTRRKEGSRKRLPTSSTHANDDADANRSVRVFISSTFVDMEDERQTLVEKTFPALHTKFGTRGVGFTPIDLRWGVTEDDVRTGKTLPICLREVDRCEPYFLGLLGERYGTLLTREMLTPEGIADFPVLAEGVGRSLTEIEIMQGVLRKPQAAKRALFFERDATWLRTLSAEQRTKYQTSDKADRAKLAKLKARIRASGARIISYAAPWDINRVVETAMSGLIEAQFPEMKVPSPFEETMRLHRAYARERRGVCIGTSGYIAALDQWMERHDAPPMLVTGGPGGGKSTLIANWLFAWRRAHPKHVVFEHYMGAAPDSANPKLVMRRLWEALSLATGGNTELPSVDADLMDVASGLAQVLAQAEAFAERNGAVILIALDGLERLASDQDLRWLPIVPRVKLLASSLDGEAKAAALARGWTPLEVKPLSHAERNDFIATTLNQWGRKLSSRQMTDILAHVLAGSPLFLRTVLDELRVSATNDSLDERLNHYLEAVDLSDLFFRVLERSRTLGILEEQHGPDHVANVLRLIWASRAGMEESKINAITGAPIALAIFRDALGDGLCDRAGRVVFRQDYLKRAVENRYFASDAAKRAAHLAIADHFEMHEPDARQVEELPYQLMKAEEWYRLEALLLDLGRFELWRGRGDGELWGYWSTLKERVGRDPETQLRAAFDVRVGGPEKWTVADVDLAFSLCEFLDFAGAHDTARASLQQQLAAACERLFGPDDPRTAARLSSLATGRSSV